MMISTAAALLLLTTQETPAPVDRVQDGREALAARVAKAHRGTSEETIDRYRATITIKPLGKKTDNVDVELVVLYGTKIAPAKGGEPVEMIRYSVSEGDKPLERGKDPRPWQRIGKRVTGLLGRGDPVARDLLESHTRLCKQMLQFLDPGAILRGLRGKDPVRTTILNLGRKAKIECEFVSGRLASFPVFRSDDKSVKMRAVFMEAWIEKKTARLAAVKVFPIAPNGKPMRGRGEFIVLRNYATSKGVLVPQELMIFEENGDKREPRAKVILSKFELNAKLTRSDFRRPD